MMVYENIEDTLDLESDAITDFFDEVCTKFFSFLLEKNEEETSKALVLVSKCRSCNRVFFCREDIEHVVDWV